MERSIWLFIRNAEDKWRRIMSIGKQKRQKTPEKYLTIITKTSSKANLSINNSFVVALGWKK